MLLFHKYKIAFLIMKKKSSCTLNSKKKQTKLFDKPQTTETKNFIFSLSSYQYDLKHTRDTTMKFCVLWKYMIDEVGWISLSVHMICDKNHVWLISSWIQFLTVTDHLKLFRICEISISMRIHSTFYFYIISL